MPPWHSLRKPPSFGCDHDHSRGILERATTLGSYTERGIDALPCTGYRRAAEFSVDSGDTSSGSRVKDEEVVRGESHGIADRCCLLLFFSSAVSFYSSEISQSLTDPTVSPPCSSRTAFLPLPPTQKARLAPTFASAYLVVRETPRLQSACAQGFAVPARTPKCPTHFRCHRAVCALGCCSEMVSRLNDVASPRRSMSFCPWPLCLGAAACIGTGLARLAFIHAYTAAKWFTAPCTAGNSPAWPLVPRMRTARQRLADARRLLSQIRSSHHALAVRHLHALSVSAGLLSARRSR
jgi:hypothetical protein